MLNCTWSVGFFVNLSMKLNWFYFKAGIRKTDGTYEMEEEKVAIEGTYWYNIFNLIYLIA